MSNDVEKMMAAVSRHYGSPSVVQLEEIDRPTPSEGEIVVKVCATTVNRTDCGFRSGLPKWARIIMGWPNPKFQVLGCEFAGEVIGVGDGVKHFQIGDRVFGYNEDDYGFGGHAEFKTVNVNSMVARIPEGLDYSKAAPACEGAHYAIGSLDACKVKRGTRLLINGATGGIGSAALQLAHTRGADIVAVCGTHHQEIVRKMGARITVDYQKEEFTVALRDHTFDVIFDSVGKSSFSDCKPLLARNGVYTSTELGQNAINPLLALWTKVFGQKVVKFPLPKIRQSDIEFLAEEMAAGRFLPMIDRIYELEDIVEAYRYVETGQKIGNVVINMPINEQS